MAIKAQEVAEREALGVTVETEVRKTAANDDAAANRVTADASMHPKIMEQAMEPAEKIENIKVFHITGAPASASAVQLTVAIDSGNLSDQLVNALLKHRANVPLLDSILKEAGLESLDPRAIVDDKLFQEKAVKGEVAKPDSVDAANNGVAS